MSRKDLLRLYGNIHRLGHTRSSLYTTASTSDLRRQAFQDYHVFCPVCMRCLGCVDFLRQPVSVYPFDGRLEP